MRLFLFIFCLNLIFIKETLSQSRRYTDENNIGWTSFFGTLDVSRKTSLHGEYQLRRTEWLRNPQQHLIRTGVNYQATENFILHIGYGFIKTYPYGDVPIASTGHAFPEHRIYQQIVLKQTVMNAGITHRFRLEQRWLGKPDAATGNSIEHWTFLNRFRYLLRTQIPIRNMQKGHEIYLALQDEIFIGFGKNIGENIFDQNRLGILAGLRFNKNVALEAGYLGQILQQGGLSGGKTVFQHNKGFQISTFVNLKTNY